MLWETLSNRGSLEKIAVKMIVFVCQDRKSFVHMSYHKLKYFWLHMPTSMFGIETWRYDTRYDMPVFSMHWEV